MLLAYDYPLMDVFFSVIYVVLWITFIMTLLYVLGDVFRAKDMRGIAKAVWLLWILFMPFVGVMTYVIVRRDVMAPTPGFRARKANEAASEGYLHLRG